MYQAHCRHAYPPEKHNKWYELAGPESLEEDIGERLGKRVGNEEERKGSIVLTSSDIQGIFKPFQSRVPNIRSVKEADEVEKAQPGD